MASHACAILRSRIGRGGHTPRGAGARAHTRRAGRTRSFKRRALPASVPPHDHGPTPASAPPTSPPPTAAARESAARSGADQALLCVVRGPPSGRGAPAVASPRSRAGRARGVSRGTAAARTRRGVRAALPPQRRACDAHRRLVDGRSSPRRELAVLPGPPPEQGSCGRDVGRARAGPSAPSPPPPPSPPPSGRLRLPQAATTARGGLPGKPVLGRSESLGRR